MDEENHLLFQVGLHITSEKINEFFLCYMYLSELVDERNEALGCSGLR